MKDPRFLGVFSFSASGLCRKRFPLYTSVSRVGATHNRSSLHVSPDCLFVLVLDYKESFWMGGNRLPFSYSQVVV